MEPPPPGDLFLNSEAWVLPTVSLTPSPVPISYSNLIGQKKFFLMFFGQFWLAVRVGVSSLGYLSFTLCSPWGNLEQTLYVGSYDFFHLVQLVKGMVNGRKKYEWNNDNPQAVGCKQVPEDLGFSSAKQRVWIEWFPGFFQCYQSMKSTY